MQNVSNFPVSQRRQESFKNINFRYDGRSFGEFINDSMFSHSFVQLGKYKDSPFVTGSFQTNETNNARTEIFNLTTDSWEHDNSYDYPHSTL